MICCCLNSEPWPMRTEWLRSNLPDSLTRGARAVCGYKLTSCNVSDKTIYARGVLQPKSECHAFFDLLRSVYSRQSVCSANIRCSVLWKGSRVLSGETIPFQENPRPFSCGFKVSSISLCPHHIPPNEGARCSPQNLKSFIFHTQKTWKIFVYCLCWKYSPKVVPLASFKMALL